MEKEESQGTMIRYLSFDDISATSVHFRHTVSVVITAHNTRHISYDRVKHFLLAYTELTIADITSIYNLGNAYIWYITLTDNALEKKYAALNEKKFTTDDGAVVSLQHMDKLLLKATLHWVPPSFNLKDVKLVVKSISNPTTEFKIIQEKACTWGIQFTPDDPLNIPHYLSVRFTKHGRHTILLELKGRTMPCFYFDSFQHTSSFCTNLNKLTIDPRRPSTSETKSVKSSTSVHDSSTKLQLVAKKPFTDSRSKKSSDGSKDVEPQTTPLPHFKKPFTDPRIKKSVDVAEDVQPPATPQPTFSPLCKKPRDVAKEELPKVVIAPTERKRRIDLYDENGEVV